MLLKTIHHLALVFKNNTQIFFQCFNIHILNSASKMNDIHLRPGNSLAYNQQLVTFDLNGLMFEGSHRKPD